MGKSNLKPQAIYAPERKMISQKENYANNHGFVPKSTSTMYFNSKDSYNTILSVLNYFKYKNNIDIMACVSIRDLEGRLIDRRIENFEQKSVLNINILEEYGDLEGSACFEFYSNKNLRIPYAAVIGYYFSETSCSAVHTYGRIYNEYEREDGLTLTNSYEGNFSIRLYENEVWPEFIFHNGNTICKSQDAAIRVWSRDEEIALKSYSLSEMKPFETKKIDLSRVITKDIDKAHKKEYCCSINYSTGGSFQRALVGNKSLKEVQYTHSNFDYSAIDSDYLDVNQCMHMVVPGFQNKAIESLSLIVYPTIGISRFVLEIESYREQDSKSSILRSHNIEAIRYEEISLEKNYFRHKIRIIPLEGDALPTRIPFVVSLKKQKQEIPSELSLGAYSDRRPNKRFSWIHVIDDNKNINSTIYASAITEIYGDIPKDIPIILRLYTEDSTGYVEKKITFAAAELGFNILDLFNKSEKDGKLKCNYISMFCEYGGLMWYNLIENNDTVSMEHNF
ncbi:hypothetical protein [Synechococcus sp. N26]|uniref:hypothetical protein n=1 Tax=Synechococcus sp. N26 TaxID=2575513 RepID=UPI0010BCEFF8|nr:hypothetical protein [Synechococcus sp. N26]